MMMNTTKTGTMSITAPIARARFGGVARALVTGSFCASASATA